MSEIKLGSKLFEDEKKKIDAINEALVDGENSGTPKIFYNEEFKHKMRKKYI